jgi:hypothetical protein
LELFLRRAFFGAMTGPAHRVSIVSAAHVGVIMSATGPLAKQRIE